MSNCTVHMASLLHQADEGMPHFTGSAKDKGSPPLTENVKGHYRRKKTNKAPRKRSFIANMTKLPKLLTDSLEASARGTGQSPTGTPAHNVLALGSTSATTPEAAQQQQQQHRADAALQSLPVLHPPVVWGSKELPSTMNPSHSNQSQPYFYDADLAAALADFNPQETGRHSFVSTAFRAVTTALDQLPPSSSLRAICTGLDAMPPMPLQTVASEAIAFAPVRPASALSRSKEAVAPQKVTAKPVPTRAPTPVPAPTLAFSPAPQPSFTSAASATPPMDSMVHGSMSAPGSPTMPKLQASSPPHSNVSSRPASPTLPLSRQMSDSSARSTLSAAPHNPDLVLQGLPVFSMAKAPSMPLSGSSSPSSDMTPAFYPAARSPTSADGAAATPAFAVHLEPSGWSQLPPTAAAAAGHALTAAGPHGEWSSEVWNPTQVLCLNLINSGAHGAVYQGCLLGDEGRNASVNSPFPMVAVKCLRQGGTGPAAPSALRSFQVEAELLPSLSHPHVVPVYYANADPAAGEVCLVQELASLGTLADYIHRRPSGRGSVLHQQQLVEQAVLTRLAQRLCLPATQLLHSLGFYGSAAGDSSAQAAAELRRRVVVLCILQDVSEALSYLAALPQPVVHRDVKPRNVLITAQGSALLADFGVAKLAPGMRDQQQQQAAISGSTWGACHAAPKTQQAGAGAGAGAAAPSLVRPLDASYESDPSVSSAKRRRVIMSSQGRPAAPQLSSSPALAPPLLFAAPGSPIRNEDEYTAWLDSFLNKGMDMELDLPSAVPSHPAPAADADSLGWLHELLGPEDDVPPAGPPAAALAAVSGSGQYSSGPGLQQYSSGHLPQQYNAQPPQQYALQQYSSGGSDADASWPLGGVPQSPAMGTDLLNHELQGTAHYAAPEDLLSAPKASGLQGVPAPAPLGPAADVFSLGYCVWEALSGVRPWTGVKASALVHSVGVRGVRPAINRGWSLRLQGLMRRLWQADPAARPAAREVSGELELEIRTLIRMPM